MEEKKPRGRPATGRAMDGTLYMRVPKDKKEHCQRLIKDFLSGRIVKEDAAKPIDPTNTQDANVALLLADVERLTSEVAVWKEKFDRCTRASESQLVNYWKRKYDEAMASLARSSDYSQ